MLLPTSIKQKIVARVPTAVVIIGGGLTSAQIADQCIENGVGRVFLVMRGPLKCRSQTDMIRVDVDILTLSKTV